MDRRTDVRRDSQPKGPRLFTNPEEKARREARNVLLQYQEVLRLIQEAATDPARFKLRPSTIQNLQRIAIQDIYTCAGNYRRDEVVIHGTSHKPPPFHEVPRLVEELCDYLQEHWGNSAIHLSAYVMWRLNWVHPFAGGNGRTARAVSYLVLGARLGYLLPGTLTIPDQIVAARGLYYQALDAADAAWAQGQVDMEKMEELLASMLARQLVEIHTQATGREPGSP